MQNYYDYLYGADVDAYAIEMEYRDSFDQYDEDTDAPEWLER